MHPNSFIEQLWKGDETNEVFIAMSYALRYKSRYIDVFQPAIEAVKYRKSPLRANKVDESKTGDSILTEIVRGICQARLVIADVSDLSESHLNPEPLRSGNVMYELGLAHAVKSPAKVVIVRDDSNKILFDLSSIPHTIINFSSKVEARNIIISLLADRLREAEKLDDLKLRAFMETISQDELVVLLRLWNNGQAESIDLATNTNNQKLIPLSVRHAFINLRDAGLARSHLTNKPFSVMYSLTERGQRACLMLGRMLQNSGNKNCSR